MPWQRLHNPCRSRGGAWLAWLACGAALIAGCDQSREQAPAERRGVGTGSAGKGASSSEAREGTSGSATDAGTEASGPAREPTPGDVSATPAVQADKAAIPDAGLETASCEARTAETASGVTALEAVLGKADDGTSDDLLAVGDPVAIDGDTLAIGALRGASQVSHGSVLVFVRSGETWTQEAELLPPADEPDNWFGKALAIDGDTLAVGAPEEFFDPPYPGHGRVHVFTRTTGLWHLDATLTAETPSDGDRFGEQVALDGDTLAVVTSLDTLGRIEVFERDEAGFRRAQILDPAHVPEAQADGNFVATLALDGDILAAGVMPALDDPGQRVHVFERAAGRWQATALLVGDRPAEAFGMALALQGRTLVVGDAYLGTWHATASEQPIGGAYVFERACDASWTQRALLAPITELTGGAFGRYVAIDGARILVADPSDALHASGIDGAIGEHTDADAYTGAVHVFGPDGGGYERLTFLKPSAGAPRETYFGEDLAASDGRVVIGAHGQDAAYVFR